MVASGCGDDGQPRDDAISAAIDAVWTAAGVEPEAATTFGYAQDFFRQSSSCGDVPEDDRWIASRASDLPGALAPQDQVYDGAIGYLEREGFTLQRFRARAVDRVAVRGDRDDLVVLLDVSEDGGAHLLVRAGPCSTGFGDFGEERYERVD